MGACGLDDVGPAGLLDGVDFGGLLGGFEVDLGKLELDIDPETWGLDPGTLELDIDPETWGLDLKTLDESHEGR